MDFLIKLHNESGFASKYQPWLDFMPSPDELFNLEVFGEEHITMLQSEALVRLCMLAHMHMHAGLRAWVMHEAAESARMSSTLYSF